MFVSFLGFVVVFFVIIVVIIMFLRSIAVRRSVVVEFVFGGLARVSVFLIALVRVLVRESLVLYRY